MKRLTIIICALAVTAIAPSLAGAADPVPKNAAKYCKALKAASGSNFATLFGAKKNAYGKCVSQTAKKQADEDAEQQKTAKTNAAKECKAEMPEKAKGNAFGKCVSEKAKAKKAAADAEDKAEQTDRINAAKTCKAARKANEEQFGKDFGTARNAFGKCVSKTAKELAAERKAS
jgi:hypothetical protein